MAWALLVCAMSSRTSSKESSRASRSLPMANAAPSDEFLIDSWMGLRTGGGGIKSLSCTGMPSRCDTWMYPPLSMMREMRSARPALPRLT